jgi:hypothetical protein
MLMTVATFAAFRPSLARWHRGQGSLEEDISMDMLRRLFGGDEPRSQAPQSVPRSRNMSADEQAVERYRYLLRTAPPETIEEAHAEAFAKLTAPRCASPARWSGPGPECRQAGAWAVS